MEMVNNVVLTLEAWFGSYVGFLRYAIPALSALLLLRCILPLLTFRREPEIWGWLNLEDGSQIPITHWENVIGHGYWLFTALQRLINLIYKTNQVNLRSSASGTRNDINALFADACRL